MGRAPCCDKANVKRGPWSPEEDAILRDYMDKFGTCTNWIALPHKAGLKRCGKSCRLRWLNYLRPNIKHGEFSDEEDRVICTLYATIGSRWSIIAGQLPGRTDNDIKNYWNTKLKKKLMGMITIPQQQWKPLPPLPPPTSSSDLSQYHTFITNPSSLLTSQFLPPLMNLNYSSTTTTTTTTPPNYNYNKSPYFLSETNTSLANTSLQVEDSSLSFLGFGNDDQVMMMNGSCSSGDGSSRDMIKQEADQTLIMFQDQGSSSSSYYTKSNIIATSAAFGNNNNASGDNQLLNATDRDEAATHGDDLSGALLEDVKRLICSHDLTQEKKKKTHEEKNIHYFW